MIGSPSSDQPIVRHPAIVGAALNSRTFMPHAASAFGVCGSRNPVMAKRKKK